MSIQVSKWSRYALVLSYSLSACTLLQDPLVPRDSGAVDTGQPPDDADQRVDDADPESPPGNDADAEDRADVVVDDGDDVNLDAEPEDAEPECITNCGGRACGSDGCGDVCGNCREGENCSDGLCVVAEIDCGDAWEECCEGNVCHEGLCRWGSCAPCGTSGLPCCYPDPKCAPGLICMFVCVDP